MNKISIPQGIFIVTPSLEGWPTKVEEAPFPHEVKLTLLDTNPVFIQSNGKIRSMVKLSTINAIYSSHS